MYHFSDQEKATGAQSESHGYRKDNTQKDKETNRQFYTYFNKPNFPFFCTNYTIISFPSDKFCGDESPGDLRSADQPLFILNSNCSPKGNAHYFAVLWEKV